MVQIKRQFTILLTLTPQVRESAVFGKAIFLSTFYFINYPFVGLCILCVKMKTFLCVESVLTIFESPITHSFYPPNIAYFNYCLQKCSTPRIIWKQWFMQKFGGQTECIIGDSKMRELCLNKRNCYPSNQLWHFPLNPQVHSNFLLSVDVNNTLATGIRLIQNGGSTPRVSLDWFEVETERKNTATAAKTIHKDPEKHRWWRAYGFSNWRRDMATTKSLRHAKGLFSFQRTCKCWLQVLERLFLLCMAFPLE